MSIVDPQQTVYAICIRVGCGDFRGTPREAVYLVMVHDGVDRHSKFNLSESENGAKTKGC